MSSSAPRRHRVFVTGSGRSGTTVTARGIGRITPLQTIRYEVRFVAAAGGLGDFLAGRVDVDTFVDRMRRHFYLPARAAGGLHRLVERDRLDATLDAFRDAAHGDPATAARLLVEALLDPLGTDAGWVEHTPETIRVGAEIGAALPEARLVDVVRDGRDVAVSVAARSWGPDDPVEALRWWAHRVAGASEVILAWGARAERLSLEEIVAGAGQPLVEAVGRLGIPVTRPDVIGELVDRDAAHVGRWRQAGERAAIDRTYAATLEWMAGSGGAVALAAMLPSPDRDHARAVLDREIELMRAHARRTEERAARRLDAMMGRGDQTQ